MSQTATASNTAIVILAAGKGTPGCFLLCQKFCMKLRVVRCWVMPLPFIGSGGVAPVSGHGARSTTSARLCTDPSAGYFKLHPKANSGQAMPFAAIPPWIRLSEW